MTRPVNLYAVTRIRDEEAFNRIEKHQSQRTAARTSYHEIESLRLLTDALVEKGVGLPALDGFFFGFHIPQIGKEFDLLKLTDKSCLNIELKSQEVPKEQIAAQLRKNRHYLSHLGKRLNLYTVVTNSLSCYKLSLGGQLQKVTMEEIAAAVNLHAEEYLSNIDDHFRASEYLVSPIHTPRKFIQGEYFLTQMQEQVKKSVLESVDKAFGGAFYHITGKPGTGKTLLIYDLAKSLSRSGSTLVIHCGKLVEGQRIISREIENITILSAEEIQKEQLSDYNFILVDESHRMEEAQFTVIAEAVQEMELICIFSSDPEQVLTTVQRERNIVGRIRALPLAGEFVLSERIRMNREMQSFILQLKNLAFHPAEPQQYLNVEVGCANTTAEAQNLLAYYRAKGYVFINYTIPSHGYNTYQEFEEDFDTEHVIGQEYDKVVMLMDSSFYYDDEGVLRGVPGPDPDLLYPNLFYQGITRVREKLALIVVNAPELFRMISGILVP